MPGFGHRGLEKASAPLLVSTVTCRYAHSFSYIDDNIWLLTDIDGKRGELFELDNDPDCQHPIEVHPDDERFDKAWSRILEDADGDLPDYRGTMLTDTLGLIPWERQRGYFRH